MNPFMTYGCVYIGCKWDNMSRSDLFLGLLLVEYFLEYIFKIIQKSLKFSLYYYF
jgi:hypothetical protein